MVRLLSGDKQIALRLKIDYRIKIMDYRIRF